MSPCADFRWRFFELSLSVIVLVSRRQLALEEAVATVFSRVAVLERERCFFISYAEAMPEQAVHFQSHLSMFSSVRNCTKDCGFGSRRRAEHEGTIPARAQAMDLEALHTSAAEQCTARQVHRHRIASRHGSGRACARWGAELKTLSVYGCVE